MSGKIKQTGRKDRARSKSARLLCSVSFPALALFALPSVAHAQSTTYWDGGTTNGGNPAANANGGNGNWDNTTTNWDTAATAGADTAWTSGDNAVFIGTGGTVTLTEAITAHNLTFLNDFTLQGSTLTLSGPNPTINIGAGNGASFFNSLAGTSGLEKIGSGTIALAAANTLTGGITVTGGALRLFAANSANGVNNIVTVNGGGLQVWHANAFGGDTAASRLRLADGTSMSLNIGAGTLTHDVTLLGATGSILGAGTWNGTVVLSGPTTLQLGGSTLTVAGNLSDNGGVLSVDTRTLGGTIVISGNLGHSGGLLVGNDTRLTGAKSYSGDTVVSGFAGGSWLTYLNAAAISPNSNVKIGDASTIGLIQFGYANPGITLGTGGGQFQFLDSGGFMAQVSGVNVGLTLNGGAALTWGAGNFIGNGEILYLGTNSNSSTGRELNLTNAIDLGSQQRTVYAWLGSRGSHGVLSGTLSGTGGLLVVGNGILELRGTNIYTGATEVQSALMLGSPGALPGGIGATGGLSNLQLNGTAGLNQDDGLIVLNSTGGDFLRGVGTGADQVQWLSSGGFAAVGADRTVNLGGAGALLTWGLGGFVPNGQSLVFGSSVYADAAINFQNAIDLGAVTRTIEVNNLPVAGRTVYLNGVISGSGGLLLDGRGDIALTALNSFTGNLVLGSTLLDSLRVRASTIGNIGSAGNLGNSSAIELKSNAGSLTYTGAGETTNRNWITGLRNGGAFSILNDGTGALQLSGAVTKDSTAPANTLQLGGTFNNTTTSISGDGSIEANPNIVSGVISESSGTLSVTTTNGTWRLTGANTYSGVTNVVTGSVLEVTTLANGGQSSSIGDSSNASTNLLLSNGTLRYVGTGSTTDRLFQIDNGSHLESSGTGPVVFTNPGLLTGQGAAGGFNFWLGGTNTGENILTPVVTNLFPTLDAFTQNVAIVKEDAGLWALAGNNNANANAYTGNTYVRGGALKLNNAGAITGGLGVTSNHGPAGSTQRSSLILFDDITGGVLGLTAASGSFTRSLTTVGLSRLGDGGTPNMQDDDTFTHGVRWTGSGGFAAWDGTQVVNIGGNATPTSLTWNTGGFVPNARELIFGYDTANGTVDFQNPVGLVNAARTIRVNNGTAAVDAIMSGAITSATTAGALTKTGAGTLALTTANTYSGFTNIQAGTLQIGNGGGTGTLGTGNVSVASGATVALDRNNSYVVANQITGVGGAGTLRQQGTGTTVLTSATNSIGATEISAGTLQVDGALTTSTVAMTGTSTLTANGTVGASAGGTSIFTGDVGASTINVAAAGTLRGSGDLGGGSDVVNLTGTLNTGTGTLSLGDGDDTFALNDPALLTGGVLGGTGTDTLQVNNAAARTLTGTQVGEFETLNKTLGGTLTLTGTHGYANSVNVAAGALQANGVITTQAITLAEGAALTVNGTVQAAGGNPATMTGDAGITTITVNAGATLAASGDLGGGSDTLTLAGTLNSGAGTLSLGDGNDTLVLNDPAVLTGGVAGGAGTDALQVNNAANRTLTAAQASGFETLDKTLGGILSLTGAHDFSAGTTVQAGVLALGNGTTAGSVAGNILNNAQVSFNSPGTQTYAGTITGTGTVVKNGTGTMVLTGNNAYSGLTDVFAGALIVNGDQSGAMGNTFVNANATLGGSGVIGGNVNVPSFGRLSPGDPGNAPGTLTINGNLTLGSAANLDFDFGQANVPGGPLNDLINVGGNLTLDGRINVTQTPGGSFGPGVYRIINYAGTLTNNGLNVASPDYFVQTSVANQVNLVNSAGLSLSFWDGDAGPRNDGTVNGGSGTWRAAGDVNWTDVSGLFAAPFANASFAIFQGAAGTVAVDNTNGAVQAVGMQFAVGGYTVQGGDLVLVDDSGQAGLQSIIRVGDGTAASSGYTATIASNLSGATQLVKTDAGTLVLSGTNTYTGGTAVNGGTLRISSDANLGGAGGLSLNGGTLNTTASITSARAVDLAGAGTFLTDTGTTLTLSGAVSGAGALTKDGAGDLVLTGANTYTGATTINGGNVRIGNGGTTGSIIGNVASVGGLYFNRSDTVMFAGVYSGSGRLFKEGAGALILTGNNTATGDTRVSAGTLQIGAGGTTGSISDSSNILISGPTSALVFNRSDTLTYGGNIIIAGAAPMTQAGTGTTILTGTKSGTGPINVAAGTLLMNGNASASSGLTSVASGATLGGTGVIGGSVAVADGGTLAPGSNGVGTLTINGNLALAGASSLAYEFGQSNVVGGPLNDLTQVGGNLALDGMIDVALAPGGSFGPGLYRVISYGGTLSDQGLALGAMPVGSTVAVQTSVAGQVNLINAAGGTFNFWDGAAPANESNNLVDGGSGTWQNSSGNNDWTTTSGAVSGPYTDGAFAIFAAASGSVSVDNGLGTVSASGMQFASDGYTITGQDLTLVGPQSTIRVGDGSSVGVGFTAAIDAALVGNSQLVKADLGTLELSGTNTYTGGTRIDAGTLRISRDANLGDATGGLSFGGGTLHVTADVTSDRNVEMIGDGSIVTDAGASLVFTGTLTGSGNLIKDGTGILALNDTSSHTGTTDVRAGSLFVNGDQSAALGLTSVATAASLGGSGIIGGDVVVADGGTLAPGNSLGTLTINGDLVLSSGSLLAFEFGEANVAGGALNDLVNVGGDLVLDGTIDVTVSTGGSFGPGIYRVFNYGGTLTNNGLALGTMPGGSAVSVQTAVAGQVNLVNTAGLSLSFWDGDVGPKNNGTVDGGNGTWRAAGALNNWTDMNGSVNADYAQDSFAIFSAAPGTVTVDDIGGNVLASGLQFASDGYTITGDALTLTGTQAIVQVGDGSTASAGYTATIDAELTGSAGLVKTDAGTLVLAGTNSYTGGTTINGGTVRVAADANLGDAAGGLILGGGTLNTTASFGSSRTIDLAGAGTFLVDAATQLNLDGLISGAGAFVKQGNGVLVLTANNTYAGGTTIATGTLQIGNGGTTGSVVGDIVNNGELILARSDGYTIAGQISGTGAVRKIGGTAILTANNSYTGGTTNASGVLQLGNGGTTGGITGDIINAGTLVFNRSDVVTFGGTISGSGALDQFGSGTTILTGANSYSGATTVSGGTLLINGDQSLATGLTTAVGGSTLGGTGTIGGDVFVGGGATLAPGSNGVGALTINGNLGFSPNGLLNVEFGQANAPGSPLNDVVNVGGDLALDGTLNVAVAPGGAFDIGLYRVINYSGTLTDNGLAIGTLPTGADAFVQTAVAGQVNLINTGGAVLNFWDGAAGPKFNGAVNGGDGAWQNGSGNDNWADATGAVNAGYEDGAFAIFTGTAGTVTIDNSLGAVTASGLQFATNGYTIGGGALTLTGPQSVVRVGDGTAGGAAYTATIGAELAGTTQLVKTDLGTLVLTGTNSYTGGTAINGGTVRIASDANLGAAAGGLSLNGGTLNTTADLSSARAVDLAGAGTFLTDPGTTLTLSGGITGAGSLTKSGTGTLVLSGTGGHTGATSVGAGTLLVNGNYAGATGATSVASGASLGGTGTIGGDVTLADGATLTPGAGGAGTLTINGDLSLAAGTTLAYEFGAANVTGGALNDLVNVGGDLTLDGTINVTVPAGGAFDVGVYRVLNYGGTLTNNGLTLGALPVGSDVDVQTSVAGQVNLVNAAGLTLNFWDGAAGPKNNGVINGGTGTWQNSAGNDNWTNANGTVNAAYSDAAFAIFGGTGGTVTVDNGLGQVTAAGMQFAANGYTITGNAIALTGPQSIIRVGDGSTAGAGFTATINSALSGDTQLVKTDAGTLVLGGTNTYTGGTLINGGTVQISADANLGAASGDVTLDGGTLATSANLTSARDIVMAGAGTISTASGTTFTFTGQLSGTGVMSKAGAGTLLLTGDNSAYAGSTQVEGTLTVNGSLCGNVNVTATGRLQGTGTVCTTVNAGTVATGNSIGTLTVLGSYTGSGGTLEVEAELGGDASPTDLLVVTNGTAGSTTVEVINVGGLGAQTVEGIKIVDVTGGTSAGTFTLDGDYTFEGSEAVIAGAYGYRLSQGGTSTPTDGDWYLRSALLDGSGEPAGPLYQPGVPIYESYASTLQTLNGLSTLQERVGNRQWSGFTQGGVGMWGRIEGARLRPEAAISTSGTDVDTNTWGLQIGFDKALHDSTAGTLTAGINGRYGTADARIRSQFGNGEIDTSGYSLGATLTWYGNGGFYADAQAQVSWYDSDLDSDLLGSLIGDSDGSGEAFSLEIGQRLPIGGSLSLTPQAQIIYSNVRFDEFIDPNDATVSSEDGDSLRGRLGLSLDHQRNWQQQSGDTARTHFYGFANLEYEMLDGSRADVSGTPILRRDDRLWGELGIGGSYSWGDGRFTIFSEVSANTALSNFGDSNGLRANAGFRLRF